MSSVHSEQSNEEPGRRAEGTGNSAQLRLVIDPAVAFVFEVEPNDLRAPTRRSPRTAFARQVAMYLAHVACGLSMMEVGVLFSRPRQAYGAAGMCRGCPDRRVVLAQDAGVSGRQVGRAAASLLWFRHAGSLLVSRTVLSSPEMVGTGANRAMRRVEQARPGW